MEWSDDGIVLSVRPHGETAAIAELLTRDHGRHLGLVHGGRSRRMRPVLQPGNAVHAFWRARLAEHLGVVKIEGKHAYAARAMADRNALLALSSVCSLARLLPERDPHPEIYENLHSLMSTLACPQEWPALLVRWELMLLHDLGFGLDLSACTVTGDRAKLRYVSPKSGRAVSADAGAPYHDKLLLLPEFLIKEDSTPGRVEIGHGLQLTGYFLEKWLLRPYEMPLPDARHRLLQSFLKACNSP